MSDRIKFTGMRGEELLEFANMKCTEVRNSRDTFRCKFPLALVSARTSANSWFLERKNLANANGSMMWSVWPAVQQLALLVHFFQRYLIHNQHRKICDDQLGPSAKTYSATRDLWAAAMPAMMKTITTPNRPSDMTVCRLLQDMWKNGSTTNYRSVGIMKKSIERSTISALLLLLLLYRFSRLRGRPSNQKLITIIAPHI